MNTQSPNYQAIVKNAIETVIANDRAVNEQESAALTILSDDGTITNCNKACENLLGCRSSELTGQHISRLLPLMAKVKEFKGKRAISFLRFLSHIGYNFDVSMINGTYFSAELVFNEKKYYMHVLIYPVKSKRH